MSLFQLTIVLAVICNVILYPFARYVKMTRLDYSLMVLVSLIPVANIAITLFLIGFVIVLVAHHLWQKYVSYDVAEWFRQRVGSKE